MGQSESTYKITAQWEWQSNPNPWSSEPKQWTGYESMNNYLLEKAYQNHEKKVELGDFIVFIKDTEMVQQRKNEAHKQRRVRRNEEYLKINEESKVNEEEKNRKNRFFGVETPKTYNKTFGNLEHFLTFFENRGPEIKNFVTVFKEIEETQDMNKLNKQILPLLINSITREAVQSKNKKAGNIIKLFQRNFTSLKEFYGDILTAYSMNTFLYKNLNQYLRNEDWMGLSYLLPYAFCLLKAFIWPEITGISIKNHNLSNNKMRLYRGTQLDEIALSFYNSPKFPIFSWNGVTSTSTDRKIAEDFMYNHIEIKKIPVMFVIETSLNPDEPQNLNWIDIKPFSVFPMENEIVLGPGSTFELISFHRDKRRVEILLRLVANVGALAHQGQIMHGALQAEMGMEMGKGAKIGCLEGKELEEAIIHLKGNGLIEELELIGLYFDIDTLAKLKVTLSTLTNLRRLTCSSLSSKEQKHLEIILEGLRKQKMLVALEIRDVSLDEMLILNRFAKELRKFGSLTTLNLDFELGKRMTNQRIGYLSSEGIRYLTSLTALSLNFTQCYEITDAGITSLCSQGIRHLASLTTLNLNFTQCFKITDAGVTSLCSQGIRHLTSLTTLTLDFTICFRITDAGVTSLCSQGIRHLTSLTTLTLNFMRCHDITDKGVTSLCSQGIRHLTSLTALTLDFNDCYKITDAGITYLLTEGIRGHASIKTLNLYVAPYLAKLVHELESEDTGISFSTEKPVSPILEDPIFTFKKEVKREPIDVNIKQKENELSIPIDALNIDSQDKLEQVYSKSAENSQIKVLTVNDNILGSDEELLEFCSKGLRDLTLLTTLSFSFNRAKDITDEGIIHLCSEVLRYLTSLTTLSLIFHKIGGITDKGIISICSQGIRHLTSLTSLTLEFTLCNQITDVGVASLCSQGIRHLTSLTTLSLHFMDEITDRGITNLCIEGIKHLTLLTTLSLNFERCEKITDEGINTLCSQGIRHLTSLTTLTLEFDSCKKITDEGITTLCSQGIKNLISLTTLTLNFRGCENISYQGLTHLIGFLKYFGFHPQSL